MENHEAEANMVYSYALSKAGGTSVTRQLPPDIIACIVTQELGYELMDVDQARFTSPVDQPRNFWLSVWTSFPSDDDRHICVHLDAILSCLDNFPLFIFFNGPSSKIDESFLLPRMRLLAARLCTLATKRVYACFGPARIVNTFSRVWSRLTGFLMYDELVYAASSTFCTRGTFTDSTTVMSAGHCAQLDSTHLPAAAELCKGFSSTSIHYHQTFQQAFKEARRLIIRKQLWGYLVDDHLTAILALTRRTPSVVAISKVYTCDQHRRQGYAETLVRDVCRLALGNKCKKVVLYVAKDNLSAMNVYGRVGFVGIGPRAAKFEERALLQEWIEIGFEGTDRGYW